MTSSIDSFPKTLLRPTVDFILRTQLPSGEIPWFEGSYSDPWDHIEAAMGLSVAGEYAAAERAYRWLANIQLADGSWWAAYKSGAVHDRARRESNFVAYIATGIWHHYLITGDRAFLAGFWPCVSAAMDFVLSLQTEHGEIHWAVDTQGAPMEDALLTGCSSIYKSLECAVYIAKTLAKPSAQLSGARTRLGEALRDRPHRFDRTWESKARYSMDWFYPILTGVLDKNRAKQRLAQRWDEFMRDGQGCRCVSDEPWVTVAETCELVLALIAVGDRSKACEVYGWLHQWRYEDGSYWTGYQWVEDLLWPDERPTWTAGAILLAADALSDHTPAARLLCGEFTLPDLRLR